MLLISACNGILLLFLGELNISNFYHFLNVECWWSIDTKTNSLTMLFFILLSLGSFTIWIQWSFLQQPLLSRSGRPSTTGKPISWYLGPVTRALAASIAIHIMIDPRFYSLLSSALKPVFLCVSSCLLNIFTWMFHRKL